MRRDHGADLLVGILGHLAGRQLDVAGGHADEQLAALGLVQLAALEAIAHGDEFKFAHCPF